MQQLALNKGQAKAALDVTVAAGLAAEIDAAAEAADPRHAFLRRAWFAAARPAAPVTVVGRRPDGRVIAALPIASGGWGPVKSVPGSYWPFRGFPIAADASVAELAALLGDRRARHALGLGWRLGPACADDPAVVRVRAAAAASGWRVIERPIGMSFVLEAGAMHRDGAWPRGSTLRKNRWFEKELAKTGPLDVRFVSGGDWTKEAFDALATIEAASWIPKKTGGEDAKFLAEHHRAFWEGAASDPVIAGMMKASVLTVGSRAVAFNFDLDCGDTRYAIANSYDEDLARWSPGRVLVYRGLVAAVEDGLERVDWGCGDSGYKRMMGAVEGSSIVDLLFVRSRVVELVMRRFWTA